MFSIKLVGDLSNMHKFLIIELRQERNLNKQGRSGVRLIEGEKKISNGVSHASRTMCLETPQ